MLYTKYKMTTGIGIKEAIRSGRLDVLKFGHTHNFPYDKEECLNYANIQISNLKEERDKYYAWCHKSWCNPDPYYADEVIHNIETNIIDYILLHM